MALKAGTVADFSNSMAEAMETALKAEYLAVKGEAMPDMGVEDRRLMLVAVAQGVVRYLKDNCESMKVEVDVEVDPSTHQGDGEGEVDEIETTGVLYG